MSDDARSRPDESDSDDTGVPEEAFISPDDPIVPEREEISDEAFISPDEPIVRTGPPTKPADFEEVVGGRRSRDEEMEEGEVLVTGMGNDPHLDDEGMQAVERYGDRHVADLVLMVGELADSLRQRGESALRSRPGMSRFEATLRAYCVGYLAGKREGEA